MSVARRITLRRKKRDAADLFEEEFALESLKSDRLRVSILIWAIVSSLLLVLILIPLFLDQFQSAFHGNFRSFLLAVFIIFSANLTYLIAERTAIDRLIRKRQKPFAVLKYFSAFVETSIPSAGMIAGSMFLGPIYTLFTPAAFLYPLFISLSALRLNVRLCIFTGTVAGVEYILLALYFIEKASHVGVEPILSGMPNHLFKGFLLVLTGVVTGLVTRQVRKRILNSFSVIEERNRISRTFGEYVSPEVMGKLLDLKPDLRSESKNVCVMFLDIRNFTGFAEKRSPEEVVQYLESLFEFMIEIVNRHHGIINKFLGDGFMAVFGAPLSDGKDCLNAVEAAQEILERLRQEAEAGTILPTTVGIGLHAGEAVTGSIGSALRREYTVIGDVVNLASRIEKLNKEFDSQLLISEMVWQAVNEDRKKAVPMGEVQVRGREQAIQVYQVA
ncbi:MAG TPA: adenylate/guanylate cyclase domain-containing protein [Pyrinomonadaceae bacterium]|jgi:adenylate cyclase|nr:adenylate/guanylate cyclase domain-containing protein [Pyrinomonadaceae bacterium]